MENFYHSHPHLFPRTALKMFPASSDDLEGSLEVVEAEIKGLRVALASANLERTQHLIQHLKMLSGKLPVNTRRARRYAGIIQTMLTQAEIRLEDLFDDESRKHLNVQTKWLLELAVYSVMSGEAKAYFDSIQKEATYAIKPISVKGNIVVAGKAEVVKGSELRRHFSAIKFHGLHEDEKKVVLSKALAIDADGYLRSKELSILKSEREDLFELRHALRDIEAYHAARHLFGACGVMSRVFLRLMIDHNRFALAHAEVDDLIAAYDVLIDNPDDAEAMRQVKVARARMENTLRDDIMDCVLLSDDSNNHQAIVVSPTQLPALGVLSTPEVFF